MRQIIISEEGISISRDIPQSHANDFLWVWGCVTSALTKVHPVLLVPLQQTLQQVT